MNGTFSSSALAVATTGRASKRSARRRISLERPGRAPRRAARAEEVADAGLAPHPNDVLAKLVDRPDPAIHGRPEYGWIDLPLLGELGNRLLPVVGARGVAVTAQLL